MRQAGHALAAMFAALLLLARPAAAQEPLLVFAAASLAGPLDEVAALYTAATGVTVKLSFASSSTLAKQIVEGAPADVYVSANVAWMDYVEQAGGLVGGTRFDWLGNSLVLVMPATAAGAQTGRPLAELVTAGRLAMADPDHVPAGQYGREALTGLGLWDAVAPRVARADNVRAALTLVARGEVTGAIVYATDAALEPGVTVVARLPEAGHAPVVYPAAAMARGRSSAASGFVAFLRGDAAAEVMRRAGFTTLLR